MNIYQNFSKLIKVSSKLKISKYLKRVRIQVYGITKTNFNYFSEIHQKI